MARDSGSVEEPLSAAREHGQAAPHAATSRIRFQAALASVVVGTIILGFKYLAYQLTGSTAILSDALESIVNVVSALFAVGGLLVVGWPGDPDDLDSRGKIDSLGTLFKGGMVALAAVLIIKEAGEALLFGHQLRQLTFGVSVTVGTGLASAALGWLLIWTGKRHRSLRLVADGAQMVSDVWTSAAATAGLALVITTGRMWLDPVAAALIGLNMMWTGVRLVRHAADGLLDEADPEQLERVLEVINTNLVPGVIRIHSLRVIRSGHLTHIDAQLVVPEFWTVEEAHAFASAFAHRVMRSVGSNGEIIFHIGPCHRQFCASCEVDPCPLRVQPFVERPWISLDEAVRADPGGQ